MTDKQEENESQEAPTEAPAEQVVEKDLDTAEPDVDPIREVAKRAFDQIAAARKKAAKRAE